MKTFFLLLLAFLSNATYAQTQNTPVTSAKEITGCWERIDFSDEAKKMLNEIEPWPSRYQWFCFEPDGTLLTYMSTKPANMTAAQLRELFKPLPKTFTYSVPVKGIIQTEALSGKETLPWGASFLGITRAFDQKVIEKGTLIMMLVDQKKNKPVYWRYLKRIQ
ncbi:MAG: hypothetical protein WC736_12410 [Gallionella sp.]